MADRVPAEFIGRARDLRRRLVAIEAVAEPAMHHALAPLQRRLQRHPVIRTDTLIDAIRAWHALPAFGRIRSSIDTSDRRRPVFAEVRVVGGKYRGIGWAQGDFEEAIAVVLIVAQVAGHNMVLTSTPVITASLHAVARRFERSRVTEEAAITELGQLALDNYARVAPEGGEFRLPVKDGAWLGHMIEGRLGEVVISLRTFLDTDAPAMAA
jgi:hypothetical protein